MHTCSVHIYDGRETYLLRNLSHLLGKTKKDTDRAAFKRKFPGVIESEHVLFAILKTNALGDQEWFPTTSKHTRADVLLDRKWVESVGLLKSLSKPSLPRIELAEGEALKIDGREMNLEAYGERKANACYFKISNIEQVFQTEHLRKNIPKQKNFVSGLDYEVFDEELFFTYSGFVKWIFSTRNVYADMVQRWMVQILFTIHLGTAPEQDTLIASIKGVTVQDVRKLFGRCTDNVAAIYLWSFGFARDLKDVMGLKTDQGRVYKYGMTKDFARRGDSYDFDQQLGFPVRNMMRLEAFTIVDPDFVADSEIRVKLLLEPYLVTISGKTTMYKECAIITDDVVLKSIRTGFKLIGDLYSGKAAGFRDIANDLRHQLDLLNKDKDLLNKDNQLLRSEIGRAEDMVTNKEKEIHLVKQLHQLELKLLENELENYRTAATLRFEDGASESQKRKLSTGSNVEGDSSKRSKIDA